MYCKKCGNEIKRGVKFCIKCGNPVTPVENNEKKSRSSKKAWVYVLIILASALLVGVIAVCGTAFYKNMLNETVQEEEEENDLETEDMDEMEASAKKEKTDKSEASKKEEMQEKDKESESEELSETKVEKAEEDAEEELGNKVETEITVAPKEHTYQIIMADVSWTDAYKAAREIPNGYLVNIDTEEEYDKIIAQIEAQGYGECVFWIGAMRRKNANVYYWVDKEGELKSDGINNSKYWLANEPSFYDYEFEKDEQYVDMFYHKKTNSWVWNDVPNDLISLLSYYSGKMAYIVEIESE